MNDSFFTTSPHCGHQDCGHQAKAKVNFNKRAAKTTAAASGKPGRDCNSKTPTKSPDQQSPN